jgi:hypothetical protein
MTYRQLLDLALGELCPPPLLMFQRQLFEFQGESHDRIEQDRGGENSSRDR